MFCINKQTEEKFKKALISGTINPDKLAQMNSNARRKFFNKLVQDDQLAKKINADFESKLILKNVRKGLVTWAKKISGIKESPRRDIIAKINRMENILKPEGNFLEDLANRRLGISIDEKKGAKILYLSQKAEKLREKAYKGNKEAIKKYGRATLDLDEYVSEIKGTKTNWFQEIINLPKTAKATLDFSAALRQGWGAITDKNWWGAFGRMFKYYAKPTAFRDLKASIIGHPNYDLAKNSGLRISVLTNKLSGKEEAFMSGLIEKIPLLRIPHEASERAYTGFLSDLRFNMFNDGVKALEMKGKDISKGSKELKNLSSVINSLTGSANLGKHDKYSNMVPLLNGLLFSPRKTGSTLNIVNPSFYYNLSPYARKLYVKNIIGSTLLASMVLGLLKMNGNKVETDIRSSNFGKVIIGKDHIDLTGGNAGVSVLLARILSGKTKSAISGKLYNLNKGYKPTTGSDLAFRYFTNKLAPLSRTGYDYLLQGGKGFSGKKLTPIKTIDNLLVPMIIDTGIQAHQNGDNLTMTSIATLNDLFGNSVNSY